MPWQLTESSAIGSLGKSQIRTFPPTPSHSAQLQLDPQHALVWEIASVKPIPAHACVPQEIYSREEDLICRYAQAERDLFAFQLDWQLLPAAGPFAIGAELWLSVQTDLLHSQPELEVTSQALGLQPWRLLSHEQLSDAPISGAQHSRGPAALICGGNENSDELGCGVWLIEPSDQLHVRVTSDSGDRALSLRMFGHFMEKGVIRRGRMQFLLAPQSVTDVDIAHAYQQFADGPLPLTA